jgi:uncharacterized repeat protein (TIGR03843 family)
VSSDDATATTGVLALLQTGELTVEGRVVAASNLTLYARVDGPDQATTSCVYKPVSGERPLWDFPDGTLAARERAAYLVSQAGGWRLVPPTVLRDGPLGPGMCQQWVVTDESVRWVDLLLDEAGVPEGWRPVVRGQDERGRAVTLVHRDDDRLRSMTLLDAVLNNADRKGGHLLATADAGLVGVDHGLCLHSDPKLRTVLWGWAGEPLTATEQQRLGAVAAWLDDRPAELADLISIQERDELRARVDALGSSGHLPRPSRSWPAIPWPAF